MQSLTLPSSVMVDVGHFFKIMPPDEVLEVDRSLGVKGILRIESVADSIVASTNDLAELNKQFAVKQQEVLTKFASELREDEVIGSKQVEITAEWDKVALELGLEEKRKADITVELADDKFELAKKVFEAVSCKKIFQRQGPDGKMDPCSFFNKEQLKQVSVAFKIEE